MTDQELRILEMQCPSTRKCLERPIDLDLEWFKRPSPKNAQVRDGEGNVFLNLRSMSFKEVQVENKLRYNRGQVIAEMLGDTALAPLTEVKKLSAIEAFMNAFSVQTIKDKFKEMMSGVKKELSYAEKVAAAMRDINNEK